MPEKTNGELWELFIESIQSKETQKRAPSWLKHYMQHFLMVNEEGEPQYTELVKGDMESRIKHFVIHKKRKGLGAAGIENYINILASFYKTHALKKSIDWDAIRDLLPEKVKKYKDREYYPEEVIAIEDKMDVRGLAVSGMMRGSGVRRGGEGTVSVGDLFPRQTEYGKIYKIWVYRGTRAEYPTACTPEVAKRFDDYQEYRMRFGELCKQFGKEHTHEYHDGEEVTQQTYKADQPHLDPEAPLIREDFDKRDKLHVMNPRRLTDERISDIVREAAIAAGIRVVNKGQKNKRHKVMISHGFRKLFKKRCRQAGMDRIILERFMGHRSGNPREGINQLMLTYDPEDWLEMEEFFIKAIPHLTITKDAKIQAELEKAKEKLKNIPSFEKLQEENRELRNSIAKQIEEAIAVSEKKRLDSELARNHDLAKMVAKILREEQEKEKAIEAGQSSAS